MASASDWKPALDEALASYPPLQIVNTFLLDGMKVVGELFGSGQMQLPFVLQSAETMKSAVAYLEPHMEKVEGESQQQGKIPDRHREGRCARYRQESG
jgi:5-methyltetrahydrofolate--homocysteine methyltransferase